MCSLPSCFLPSTLRASFRSLALPLIMLPVAGGLLAPEATAEELSQYRGPDRDGQATMFQAPETWPDKPQQVWKVEVGEGLASPVVSGDRIYLMTRQGEDEVAMALDLRPT